jgi:hypothetical protein
VASPATCASAASASSLGKDVASPRQSLKRASEPMHRHVNIHPAKHRNFSTNSASLAQGVSTRTLRVSLSAVKSLSPKLGVDGRLGRPCDVRGLARLVFRMYRDGAKPVIGANRVPLRLKIRRGIVAQRRAPPREPGTANRPTCYEGQISLFPAIHFQGIINMCDRAEPRSKSALRF